MHVISLLPVSPTVTITIRCISYSYDNYKMYNWIPPYETSEKEESKGI